MFEFKNKTVVIFSPQPWGKMKISKHHYAIELVSRGNKVYYVNPPVDETIETKVNEVDGYPGIFTVDSGLKFLRTIRFHSKYLFKLYNKYNLSRIAKAINQPVDVVWSFDFFGFCDFSFYKKQYKIAHPVDFVKLEEVVNAKGANILFSIAEEIIDDFSVLRIPSYFINHSVSKSFITNLKHSGNSEGKRLKVGYVGNLLRPDINYEVLIDLVEKNENCDFLFFGNYKKSNLSGEPEAKSQKSIESLFQFAHTNFKGVLNQEELADEMSKIDIFLICYDKELDYCKGVNYHKVMEYLATGSVTVSNHITTYKNKGLIEMISATDNDFELTNVFKKVVENITHYNSIELKEKRMKFALGNTYPDNINRIVEKINKESHS